MNNSIIQCHNLSHAYTGKVALSNVCFEVNAGEPIGLVGPNGAGKTTLFNLICGFIPISSGTLSIFGQPPGAAAQHNKVSALPQDARLDPNFSIGEQLCFYARLQGLSKPQANTDVLRVLEAVNLQDSFAQKPDTLSHGMAKRVAIAQALIGKPELVLLDEPTAGLDPVNTRNIRSIITDLSAHTSFIISSHDLAELGRVCQHILLLEQGIMSSMQVNSTEQDSHTQFITLQMQNCPAQQVITEFKQLKGVKQVSNSQKNEFIVEYNPAINAKIDLDLIVCISDKQWQYRQISRGKTLEEKLFFDAQ